MRRLVCAARSLVVAAAAFGCVVAAACNAVFGIDAREHDPSLDDAGASRDGGDGGTGGPGSADALPPPFVIGEPSCRGASVPGDACSTFVHVDGPIVVDGIATEYCNLHATVFRVMDGKLLVPAPQAGQTFDETVRFFATWTAAGMAIHAHVDDRSVQVGASPRDGDALEFYFATAQLGSSNNLSIADAVIVIASPPSASQPSRALLLKDGVELPYVDAFGRQVQGGYEIELLVRWTDLGSPEAGEVTARTLRFDLAIDVRNADAVELVSFLEDRRDAGATTCTGTERANPNPRCDTNTWCASHFAP